MIFYSVFLFSLVFKIVGYFILRITKKREKNAAKIIVDMPMVDIIVPMYNEEKVILKTIQQLLTISYEQFVIIIVDNGSTDKSLDIVSKKYTGNPKIKILNQPIRGKAYALNLGINSSESEFVICIDADTLVRPDIISKILPYFSDDGVGAISGYIKVGNRENLITHIQYIEYITNQNFERVVFGSINAIFIVPGAIGAFRRSVLLETGGFTLETVTEDNDMTLKILNNNYVIKNASDVIGFTEAPSSIKMFFRQRVRWKIGAIQVLMKYTNAFFSHPNKALSYLTIPFIWLFDILLPLFIHLVDYTLLYYLVFTDQSLLVLKYYVTYVSLDAMICVAILHQYKEKVSLFTVLWQRLLLRHLMFLVYVYILINFVNGSLYSWDKITREGNAVVE
jgi:cellulose synthase/poly-beta-1,6-N-acetylglucosamine synthase-like glycosyltransferase